ncbi:MAG: hypothetical protein OXC83_04385 [Chloroflexi bacterium]|nr:hypothetical protein [Chloroflexota bacterium]
MLVDYHGAPPYLRRQYGLNPLFNRFGRRLKREGGTKNVPPSRVSDYTGRGRLDTSVIFVLDL